MQDAHHEDEHAEALAHRDELMLRLDAIEKKLDRMSK
jgi:voltage-gated sodium channel